MLIDWFQHHQEILWFTTIAVDLSFAILLFHLFGRQGLYASIVISLLLANLQGPKLTEIFGLQTSMGVILYSSIYFATDLLSERRHSIPCIGNLASKLGGRQSSILHVHGNPPHMQVQHRLSRT